MKASHRVLCFVAGGVALAAVAVPAIASHGKVGLWNITVNTTIGGMAMPDMSKLPPEAQAAMRAHGVTMNGNTMSVQHCMTQEEVNADHPNMRNMKECQMSNMRTSGNTFSADFTCTGEMNGAGHVQFVFDSPEHYTGKTSITGTAQGHPINTVTTMEGRWVSADCKGVTH